MEDTGLPTYFRDAQVLTPAVYSPPCTTVTACMNLGLGCSFHASQNHCSYKVSPLNIWFDRLCNYMYL